MKGNKTLVTAIIGTAIFMLLGLMVIIFVGIGRFADKAPDGMAYDSTPEMQIQDMIGFQMDIYGIITGKGNTGFRILNFSNDQEMDIVMDGATTILDKYEGPIPFSTIDVGEIVQILYEPESRKAHEIKIHPDSWFRDGLNGNNVDFITNSITIGLQTYTFNKVKYIIDSEYSQLPNVLHIKPYDTIDIKGIGEDIYSVQITQQAGYISVNNLPSHLGRLEINRQRQLPLSEVDGQHIPVQAGMYSIALYIDGYEPIIIEDAEVAAGQVYYINASTANVTEYNVTVKVNNNNAPYTMTINGMPYDAGFSAALQKGDYTLRILSDGFEPYEKEFSVSGDRVITATLQAHSEEVRMAIEQEIAAIEAATPHKYSVDFETSPSGAKVFIDGEYMGMTPLSCSLGQGIYKAEFELEGYERYSTPIVIETENLQLRYLYILTPLF
ncbi:MAG: hypothetical protein BEN18_04210 [Epulopiscium sp. Nuni2H_MBin001]|nr:MAG: hypothetical protein BEN18_04210 [Epulopiscium sp. Nuni2H_MBin001]